MSKTATEQTYPVLPGLTQVQRKRNIVSFCWSAACDQGGKSNSNFKMSLLRVKRKDGQNGGAVIAEVTGVFCLVDK